MLRYKLKERIADKEFAERRRVPIIEIAEATGITRNTLSKMLNSFGASVRTENLDRLCSYFGCRIEELVEHLPDVDSPERSSVKKSRPRKEKEPVKKLARGSKLKRP